MHKVDPGNKKIKLVHGRFVPRETDSNSFSFKFKQKILHSFRITSRDVHDIRLA